MEKLQSKLQFHTLEMVGSHTREDTEGKQAIGETIPQFNVRHIVADGQCPYMKPFYLHGSSQ